MDDKDERRLKTAKYQPGKTQRKSANATKHEAREQETDLIKTNVKRVELQNITSAMEARRASLRQQIRKTRGERLDDEFESRQRWLKTVRRVGKQRTTKTERDGAKTYRCSEGGRPEKRETRRSKRIVVIFVARQKRVNDYEERRDQNST